MCERSEVGDADHEGVAQGAVEDGDDHDLVDAGRHRGQGDDGGGVGGGALLVVDHDAGSNRPGLLLGLGVGVLGDVDVLEALAGQGEGGFDFEIGPVVPVDFGLLVLAPMDWNS